MRHPAVKIRIKNEISSPHGFQLVVGSENAFPHSSVGKESKPGDPGSIPGSGRSTREGISYPLQYSWASLVAQVVKNLPAMWKTCVQSLGWEDPMEKGKGYPLQYSSLENSMDCIVHWVAKSWTCLSDFYFPEKDIKFLFHFPKYFYFSLLILKTKKVYK